jgi:hypothetical protein
VKKAISGEGFMVPAKKYGLMYSSKYSGPSNNFL